MKCFAPEGENAPMCAELPNWPDWAETESRVQSLFTEPDFDLVARAEREAEPIPPNVFRTANIVSTPGIGQCTLCSGQQPERYAETLEKWKLAAGGEGQVLLAEAMLRRGEAWAARGGGFANTVSPEAWKILRPK